MLSGCSGTLSRTSDRSDMDRSLERQYHDGWLVRRLMSNNTNARFLTMLGAFLLLALVLGVACGGDSDSGAETPQSTEVVDGTEPPDGTTGPNETVDPDATATPDGNGFVGDPTLEDDPVADETRRTIGGIERAVRRLNSEVRFLERRMRLTGSFAFGTPEQGDADWFDRCCDNSIGDFEEELQDISRSLPELVEIYEEAGDQESLGLVERIGTEVANIRASISVLSTLASRETAPTILDEITLEITALSEAATNLR